MEEKKEEDEEGDSVVLRVAPLRRCSRVRKGGRLPVNKRWKKNTKAFYPLN